MLSQKSFMIRLCLTLPILKVLFIITFGNIVLWPTVCILRETWQRWQLFIRFTLRAFCERLWMRVCVCVCVCVCVSFLVLGVAWGIWFYLFLIIALPFTLKKAVFHKEPSIFQRKLQTVLTCSYVFNLFLCLKRREPLKIIINLNKNTIEGTAILKTLLNDV